MILVDRSDSPDLIRDVMEFTETVGNNLIRQIWILEDVNDISRLR